jgi:hypothetical protein
MLHGLKKTQYMPAANAWYANYVSVMQNSGLSATLQGYCCLQDPAKYNCMYYQFGQHSLLWITDMKYTKINKINRSSQGKSLKVIQNLLHTWPLNCMVLSNGCYTSDSNALIIHIFPVHKLYCNFHLHSKESYEVQMPEI